MRIIKKDVIVIVFICIILLTGCQKGPQPGTVDYTFDQNASRINGVIKEGLISIQIDASVKGHQIKTANLYSINHLDLNSEQTQISFVKSFFNNDLNGLTKDTNGQTTFYTRKNSDNLQESVEFESERVGSITYHKDIEGTFRVRQENQFDDSQPIASVISLDDAYRDGQRLIGRLAPDSSYIPYQTIAYGKEYKDSVNWFYKIVYQRSINTLPLVNQITSSNNNISYPYQDQIIVYYSSEGIFEVYIQFIQVSDVVDKEKKLISMDEIMHTVQTEGLARMYTYLSNETSAIIDKLQLCYLPLYEQNRQCYLLGPAWQVSFSLSDATKKDNHYSIFINALDGNIIK